MSGKQSRKQLWGVEFERYELGFVLTQGASSVSVSGDGVASCAGSSGEYTVTLTDAWKTLIDCQVLPELDHDTIATEEICELANDVATQYAAHRVMIASSVHGAADATNVVTAAAATTLATAYTLLNDLKTQYEAHRVLTAASVHGAADATNTISAADATTIATAITLANELKTDLSAHRILTAASVHGAADSTSVVTADSVTLATTPYPSLVSTDVDSKTLVIATKDPTSGTTGAIKTGGKLHVHLTVSRGD